MKSAKNKEAKKIAKFKILKASLKDAKEILEIQKLSYQTEAERYNNFCIEPLHETLEEMQKDIQDKIVLKAVMNNQIIGSVRAYEKEKETCYVGRLFVHPDFRGKGIAKALMREIEFKFKKVKRFELFTGWKSKENINLYMSLGYYPFKIEDYNVKDKVVYMEKSVSEL